jgi:hypothetical protein
MKLGPANESIQVAVVGSIWGFGVKMDGTVIVLEAILSIILRKSKIGRIVSVMRVCFGSMSEGGFVVK